MPYKEIVSAIISILVVVINDQITNKKCNK